jgi:hypothetical protein
MPWLNRLVVLKEVCEDTICGVGLGAVRSGKRLLWIFLFH